MSPSRPPGPHLIPGVLMPTWLVRFDKDGLCVSPATAEAFLEHLRQSDYTNVLFYSHGWNTDFADAVDQYRRFLAAFESVVARHPIPRFKPIFVGVTWPSVWLAEDAGPTMRGTDGSDSARDGIISEIAALMDSADREKLYALTDAAALESNDALELAKLLVPVMGDSPGEVDDDDPDEPGPEAADLLQGAAQLAIAEGEAPIPSGQDPVFDPTGAPQVEITGLSDAIDPRRIVRLFSLLQMKDRGGRVGATGVATLLRQILAATTAKVNVFGHSFGAKVMLSAICAPAALPRQVDSLLLLQPAISYLAMADRVPGRAGPGGYRLALGRVKGPIFTTFSEMDQPLHDIFHLALRRKADIAELRISAAGAPPNKFAALGGYGPRASGERFINPIPGPGVEYGDLSRLELVALDGSDNRITSHGDVANGFTAWALRHLIVAGQP